MGKIGNIKFHGDELSLQWIMMTASTTVKIPRGIMGGWIYLGANQGRGTWPQHLESLKTFSDDSPLCRLVTGKLHTAPTVFPGLASQRAHAYLYPSLANHVAPLITQNSLTDLQSGHKSQQILSPVASLTQYWIPLAERKRRGGRGRDKKNRHSL